MKTFHDYVVPAYLVRGTGQIAFWCHYCQSVHRHGDCGKGMEGGGGRGAHCFSEDSPLRGHGIYLDVLGEVSCERDLRPRRQPVRRRKSSALGFWKQAGEAFSHSTKNLIAQGQSK